MIDWIAVTDHTPAPGDLCMIRLRDGREIRAVFDYNDWDTLVEDDPDWRTYFLEDVTHWKSLEPKRNPSYE